MFLTGFADEASHDFALQIKATKELGWKFIEARLIGDEFMANISDEQFEQVCSLLQDSGVRINCYGSSTARNSKPSSSGKSANWSKSVKTTASSTVMKTA